MMNAGRKLFGSLGSPTPTRCPRIEVLELEVEALLHGEVREVAENRMVVATYPVDRTQNRWNSWLL